MAKNTYFAFKQFSVDQLACGMKVTTDACLFGAWVPVEHARQVLDIGTGTGLLALMAAQRSRAFIDAVEQDACSAMTAKANFINSPWSDRIQLFHTPVQEFDPSPRRYDVILCNPPFYTSGTRSPRAGRARSRHTDTLSHQELLDVMDRLLAPGGTACILLPEEVAPAFTKDALSRTLQESIRLYLRSSKGRRPHCRAVAYSRSGNPRMEKTLVIHTNSRTYSRETTDLLRPYYLYL